MTEETKQRRECLKQLLALHEQGKTNKEIAEALGYSRNFVCYYLLRNNRVFNGPGKTKIDLVDRDHARCKNCKLVKPLDDEHFKQKRGSSSERPYFMSICRQCTNLLRKHYRNRNVFSYRIISLKASCKRKGIPFSLTSGWLEHLFYEQNGLCFYTDEPLDSKLRSRGSDRMKALSVDRIIPEEGYIPGNVVLCTLKANTVKNNLTLQEIARWLPGWYARIMDYAGKDFAQVRL